MPFHGFHSEFAPVAPACPNTHHVFVQERLLEVRPTALAFSRWRDWSFKNLRV